MASVTELLLALGSADPAVRVPAEQSVNAARESDLSGFMLAMLAELRDDGKPPYARQMAGVLLKNAVAPSLREVAARRALETRWQTLPREVRQRVHAEVLATLGNAARDVRTVAANIIGSLSRIELPAGEWPELINILVTAAGAAGAVQHQEAALTTLGYIFEEGRDHDDVEAALQPSATAMLQVIVQCMASNDESVKYGATTALCQAMEYVHDNMQQASQRDVLVDALCNTAQTSASARTRARAMEALVKVADLYYHTLPAYITRLHAITSAAIFRDEEAVGLQALQFWISICETERDMLEDEDEGDEGGDEAAAAAAAKGGNNNNSGCLHYTQQGLEFLVQTCLQLLVRQDADQTEDDWNLSIAGGKLLQSVSDVVGVAVHTPVMNFVFANINSADWHAREAAVMAFGCLLGSGARGAHTALEDTVAQAVPGLLKYVHDSHPLVADTSAWVLAVVCEHYVDVFLSNNAQLVQLMNVVGPMIGNDADASMATRACHIVHNLALAYEDNDDDDDGDEDEDNDGDDAAMMMAGGEKSSGGGSRKDHNNNNSSSSSSGAGKARGGAGGQPLPSNELSPFYMDLVKVLLHAIDAGATFELKGSAQETLNALIDAAAADSRDAYLTLLAPELLTRMEAQLAAAGAGTGAMREEVETMLGLLCGSISALARKLRSRFEPFLDAAMQLLLRLIQRETTVAAATATTGGGAATAAEAAAVVAQPEALLAIGSIAHSVGTAMAPYLAQVVPYVTRCLCAVDEPDAVHGVVATIGDLALACTTALQPYVGALMDTLYALLLNPSVDRDLKCSFLSCLGDVVPNVLRGNGFAPYMSTLMPVVQQLFDASVAMDVRGDAEGEQYVMSLWSSTASLYSSIIQSFNKASAGELAPYLANMLRFAMHVATHAADYDETRLAAVMVVGDMASVLRGADATLRQQAKEALCSSAMTALLEQARGAAISDAQRAQINWVNKQLRKLSTA